MSLWLTALPTVRAAEESRTGIGPGLLAFAIVVLLALATFLLIRSMLHHVKKVPPTFDQDESEDGPGRDVGQ